MDCDMDRAFAQSARRQNFYISSQSCTIDRDFCSELIKQALPLRNVHPFIRVCATQRHEVFIPVLLKSRVRKK